MPMTIMQLFSPVFKNDEKIPVEYTCKGANVSPPLQWENAPKGTISFVLIFDDPDAPGGTWDHWLIYNIPNTVTALEKNTSKIYKMGLNSWKETNYGGPCPPSGEHRYFFKLYALDKNLTFSKAPTKQELMNEMKGHILADAQLMGRVSK